MGADPPDVRRADIEEIVKGSLLDGQRALNVGLADVEQGIDGEATMQ
jgi:hypothetical protein